MDTLSPHPFVCTNLHCVCRSLCNLIQRDASKELIHLCVCGEFSVLFAPKGVLLYIRTT